MSSVRNTKNIISWVTFNWVGWPANNLYNQVNGTEGFVFTNGSLDRHTGGENYANYNGTSTLCTTGDSNTYSFGNGSTDSPFSVVMRVNMTDATAFELCGKANGGLEWFWTVNNSDLFQTLFFDQGGVTNILGKTSTNTLTSYEGEWAVLSFTYNGNGSSSASGMKFYANDIEFIGTDSLPASYTAMSNTVASFNIGSTQGINNANGAISDFILFDKELSPAEIKKWARELLIV